MFDKACRKKILIKTFWFCIWNMQAIELKCGGLVVACMFDHRIEDAYSANQFLVSG